MKKILFTFLLVIQFAYILNAQSYTQWHKLIAIYSYESSRLNHVFDYGSFYISEGFNQTNSKKFLAKIDVLGNLIEKQEVPVFGCPSLTKLENAFFQMNDRIINATYTYTPLTMKKLAALYSFDTNLDTIFVRKYTDSIFSNTSVNSSFNDVKLTLDSCFIMTGYHYLSLGVIVFKPFVMKTDLNGNIIWLKQFSSSYKSFYHISVNQDSSYTMFSEKNGGSFIKLDKNGNITFELALNNYSNNNPQSDMILNNNKLYLARTVADSTIPDSTIYKLNLVCFNTISNNIVFDTIVSAAGGYNFPNLIDQYTIKVNDSKIFVTNSVRRYEKAYTGQYFPLVNIPKLFLFDLNGKLLTIKMLFAVALPFETLNDFTVTNDQCVFGVGYDYSYNDSWVCKSKPFLGMSIWNRKPLKKILVYPNPVCETLYLNNYYPNDLVIEIFNLSGKKLIQQQLPANITKHKINVRNLPSGPYLLKILSDNKVLSAEKFIKN